MKIKLFKTAAVLLLGAAAGMPAFSHAQDSNANATLAPTPIATANVQAPSLPYGVAQVLQLAQARVSDDTIIAYVRNSGNSYGLTADQIIYLQQQGLSSAVMTAMLNQPRAGVLSGTSAIAPAGQTAAAPQSGASYDQPVAQSYTYNAVTPAVTAIDPTYSAYYYQPYYYYPAYGYPYHYYPYAVYPSVSLSFGWGWHSGGWHGGGWGGGWHGGGFHGGGGWHR